MSRNFFFWFFIIAAVGTILFFYKTPVSQPQTSPVAEFGGVSLRIEYATTTAARELGLGGRASVPGDYGMLFIFPTDDLHGFWMKDTLVSLDMFWLDAQGQVVSIEQNVDPSTYPNVFYPTAPARYVLETAAGFAQAHNITNGAFFLLKNIPSVME